MPIGYGNIYIPLRFDGQSNKYTDKYGLIAVLLFVLLVSYVIIQQSQQLFSMKSIHRTKTLFKNDR